MKKIKQLIFCIFMVIAINMNAQTDWCGTVMEENSNFNTLWSQIDQSTIPTSFENEEHYILKVHFWDINLSDDSNPELTETPNA